MNILWTNILHQIFPSVLKVKIQVKSNKPILHQIYQNYENLLHERAILTTQVLFVQAELVSNIIDSCGAGDTFVACVIASLIKGRSLKTALETGCRIAAIKICQRGFQNLGDDVFL